MHTTEERSPISDRAFIVGTENQDTNSARSEAHDAVQATTRAFVALSAPALTISADNHISAQATGKEFDGTPSTHSTTFSLPSLPSIDDSESKSIALATVTIQALFSVMRAMGADSFLDSIQAQHTDLKELQRQSVEQFEKQEDDLKRIEQQKKSMQPAEIAMLCVSALGLLVSIAIPFAAPALLTTAGFFGILGIGASITTSAFFTALSTADYAIKRSPTPLTRLNEKGEEVPLEGMNIDILVDMAFDTAVRNGSIVIDGEPGQGKAGALHMSRDDFNSAKKVFATMYKVILTVLPLVCGIGAFFEGGGLALIKKLPELIKELPEKIASMVRGAASDVKDAGSKIGEFLQLSRQEMGQQVMSQLRDTVKDLGNLRTAATAERVLRITENLLSMTQSGLKIQQAIQTMQIGELRSNVSADQKDMLETQGQINLISAKMPITMDIFKQMQDARLAIAKAAALIVAKDIEPASFAARNIAAASA